MVASSVIKENFFNKHKRQYVQIPKNSRLIKTIPQLNENKKNNAAFIEKPKIIINSVISCVSLICLKTNILIIAKNKINILAYSVKLFIT